MKTDALTASVCLLCGNQGNYTFTGTDLLLGGQKTYDYHECRDCGAVYQYPMPEPHVIVSFYPDRYSIYDDQVRYKKRSQLERAILKDKYDYRHLRVPLIFRMVSLFFRPFVFRDYVRFKPDGKALDVGCGNGSFLHELKEIGWECEGVEFNLTAVKICRAHGLKVHHGDLASARFPDHSFDLIIASHIIEHLADPAAFMKEASRILKDDGRLLIKTPNSQALGRRWFKEKWFANDVPRHLVLFSPSNLDLLAAKHGLVRSKLRLETTPKYILNSIDYYRGYTGKPSRKMKFRRLLAGPYVLAASIMHLGDRIHAEYKKHD